MTIEYVPIPTAEEVAAFLGADYRHTADSTAAAAEHLPIITAMAKSHTRGRGFTGDQVAEDIRAVILTAAARLIGNPDQLHRNESAGPFSHHVASSFKGWSLVETMVLNRYRTTAK